MKSLSSLVLLLSVLLPLQSYLVESNVIAGLEWGSMKTYLKTKGKVYHLEEDRFIPGNILYSDDNLLMTTNGQNADLIVGSTFGYAEGRSALAQFGAITGFLQTNSSHVLLVDYPHHCLRYVNRITNMTSHFVGNCSAKGFRDGFHKTALFNLPWSVIKDARKDRFVIVTDPENDAVRYVDLSTGYVGTIAKSLPRLPAGAFFDSDKENVLISFSHFLGKLHVNTLAFSQVTSSANKGGLDGDFKTASFGHAEEILCLKKICLVADKVSHKLKILDFYNQKVYSLCTGVVASVDGATTNCSLLSPRCLLYRNETLLIGEAGAIRTIKVRDIFPCDDMAQQLLVGQKEKCIEVIPGDQICLPHGLHKYRIPNRNCTITINITADACHTMPCINSGICTAQDDHTYTCSCRDGWTGKNCQDDPKLMVRIEISASYKLRCNYLSDFKELTVSIAKKRYSHINLLSSGVCNKSVDDDIVFSCANDVLQVIWPTDCLFNKNSTKEKDRMLTIIYENLMKAKGVLLDLIVPSHMPSIILPTLSQEGRLASVVLTPVCLGGLKYKKDTNSCQ